jgi:hypothetical protein
VSSGGGGEVEQREKTGGNLRAAVSKRPTCKHLSHSRFFAFPLTPSQFQAQPGSVSSQSATVTCVVHVSSPMNAIRTDEVPGHLPRYPGCIARRHIRQPRLPTELPAVIFHHRQYAPSSSSVCSRLTGALTDAFQHLLPVTWMYHVQRSLGLHVMLITEGTGATVRSSSR